jgi:hypothetical protein
VKNTPCSEHFDIYATAKIFMFIHSIIKVSQDNEQLRKTKEDCFIKVFHPKLNR